MNIEEIEQELLSLRERVGHLEEVRKTNITEEEKLYRSNEPTTNEIINPTTADLELNIKTEIVSEKDKLEPYTDQVLDNHSGSRQLVSKHNLSKYGLGTIAVVLVLVLAGVVFDIKIYWIHLSNMVQHMIFILIGLSIQILSYTQAIKCKLEKELKEFWIGMIGIDSAICLTTIIIGSLILDLYGVLFTDLLFLIWYGLNLFMCNKLSSTPCCMITYIGSFIVILLAAVYTINEWSLFNEIVLCIFMVTVVISSELNRQKMHSNVVNSIAVCFELLLVFLILFVHNSLMTMMYGTHAGDVLPYRGSDSFFINLIGVCLSSLVLYRWKCKLFKDDYLHMFSLATGSLILSVLISETVSCTFTGYGLGVGSVVLNIPLEDSKLILTGLVTTVLLITIPMISGTANNGLWVGISPVLCLSTSQLSNGIFGKVYILPALICVLLFSIPLLRSTKYIRFATLIYFIFTTSIFVDQTHDLSDLLFVIVTVIFLSVALDINIIMGLKLQDIKYIKTIINASCIYMLFICYKVDIIYVEYTTVVWIAFTLLVVVAGLVSEYLDATISTDNTISSVLQVIYFILVHIGYLGGQIFNTNYEKVLASIVIVILIAYYSYKIFPKPKPLLIIILLIASTIDLLFVSSLWIPYGL